MNIPCGTTNSKVATAMKRHVTRETVLKPKGHMPVIWLSLDLVFESLKQVLGRDIGVDPTRKTPFLSINPSTSGKMDCPANKRPVSDAALCSGAVTAKAVSWVEDRASAEALGRSTVKSVVPISINLLERFCAI